VSTTWLSRGWRRTVRALNADIGAWIETWNDNPRPYVWTKAADQILESIARYCTESTTHNTSQRIRRRLLTRTRNRGGSGTRSGAGRTGVFPRRYAVIVVMGVSPFPVSHSRHTLRASRFPRSRHRSSFPKT
jgi:plasmid stabilization system protein ParE